LLEEAQSYLQHTSIATPLFGLAVQIAEALASRFGARIRQLGFAGGSRVIFGYSGSTVSWESVPGIPCPNIQDQFAGVTGGDRINLHMDESEQLYPEQSTTAIIAYHPAKYFSA